MLIKKIKSCVRYFLHPYFKHKFKSDIKHQLLNEALSQFEHDNIYDEKIINDYLCSLNKHLVSYNEFFHQYDFPSLNEEERNKYVSRAQVRMFYYDIPRSLKLNFWDKEKFLRKFSDFVYRDWMRVKDTDKGTFMGFMEHHDVICKPMASCCGDGIYKINKGSLTHDEIGQKYLEFCNKDMLVEESISNGGGMEGLHPESLNTIRVVTVRNKKTRLVQVFGAFIRMGVGNSTIDNAHAGGLFAQINVATGVIESEAININGSHYRSHPDTDFAIIGYQIPRWEEIKNTCLKAADVIPENYITGWDVVINQNEQIELIEGNHGPDWDLMQSPLKIGVKKQLETALGSKIG